MSDDFDEEGFESIMKLGVGLLLVVFVIASVFYLGLVYAILWALSSLGVIGSFGVPHVVVGYFLMWVVVALFG